MLCCRTTPSRWTFRIFFSAGEGKGKSGATGREGVGFFFLLRIQGEGVFQERGGDGGGRGSAANLGGGGKYFFSGPKCPPSLRRAPKIRKRRDHPFDSFDGGPFRNAPVVMLLKTKKDYF